MRIHTSVPALVLAALLGSTLIGCQRQETPYPKSEIGLPSADKPGLPGARDAHGPHRTPVTKPVLTEA